MPVEVTNPLTREMQAVADCRDAVRKAEFDVEEKKTALKLSKAALEECQGALNIAVDDAITASKQPRLFDPLGGDTASGEGGDGGGGGGPSSDPGSGSGGGSITVEVAYSVNPSSVASLPAPGEPTEAPALPEADEDGDAGDITEKPRGKRGKKGAA